MADPQSILSYLLRRRSEMEALLAELVELESPTDDKLALDRLASSLASRFQELGATVEILAQAEAGNHVCARWATGERGVLVLCHMDTVWPAGTLAARPWRVDEGRFYGPGALDMKGGIVTTLWAVRALRELGLLPGLPLTVLLTSDEETGSRTSRPVIEAEARRHQVVLVLEPAQPPHGALKTWRKGTGGYLVRVTGRAAHAGVDPERGINAVEELAHQVLAIQRLTDYPSGLTVSVGLVGGGTRSNVIPDQAWARVDVRVMDEKQAAELDRKMRGLLPHLKGSRVEISGGINRPPMVETPASLALYARAERLAAGLGLSITRAGSGGGSDGNFTAALGLPTLDGLGPVGEGAHAVDEHVVLSSLPERAALLAALLASLAD